MHPPTGARPLRADAERTVRTILDAAERVLGQNPNATLEQIAEAAGVARTTVHRRFANRDDLVRTMAIEAWQRMDAAVDAARPYTAPPLVALHQATANVVAIKHGAAYALDRVGPADDEVAEIQAAVFGKCDAVLRRAQAEGVVPAEADLDWVRRVYLALITETVHGETDADPPADPDTLARRVIDTLLHGTAGRPRDR
ncbi:MULTISPECIES: TetR/AcrR family transcriptional regulator [Nocardia]|uniref:TetR/AcrR family transcriptional regulator n=1 Tax=Nocardia TaxID=1817 RepID=UPI001894CEA2|nr:MULTISPECIES: TetR/AcrR family transcriptional regulator [Nocardia]MBF6348377.1 TetR/AcrR family transcriptional regulator [Nocardia flavorosea]